MVGQTQGRNGPQVMLLTGCASGIGRHLMQRMAAAGHRLCVTDLEAERVEREVAEAGWPAEQIMVQRLDVRDAEAWERILGQVVRRWGRIDVLMNVAGVVRPAWVWEADAKLMDLHLDVNAKGTILGTLAAARRMVEQGSGQIINFASLAALAPVPGIALYSASKFAVRGFSLAVAQELRPKGVAISVICPDAVNTAMVDLQLDYPQAALTFSGPRILTVEEIGDLIEQRVLPRRPLEVMVPRHRGWMAKATSLWPNLAASLAPRLSRVGLARQRQLRAKVRGTDGEMRP